MPFFTVKQYAQHWQISERRVRQLLKEGKRIKPAKKVGRDWLIGTLERYTPIKRGEDKKPRKRRGRNETKS